LPESAWWRDDFIAELTSFPAAAHDDWVDSLSLALVWINQNSGWRAGFEAFKQLCSAVAAPQKETDWTVAAGLAGAPEPFVRHFEQRPRTPQETNGGRESLMDIYLHARYGYR